MNKRFIFVVMTSVLLAGCESIPMINDLDVLKHKNRGDLLAFHTQLKTELKTLEPQTDESENRKVYIEKVGRKIAEEKEQAILVSLDREYQKHSIATLKTALDKTKEIETFSRPVYIDLKNDIEQAMNQKRGVIEGKEAEFNALPDQDAPKKVILLDEIIVIYGGQEAEQVSNQRKAYIDGLFASSKSALATKRHEDVLLLLNNIEKIDPAYPGLTDMRNNLVASEYETQFWDAVENGNADRVYASFHRLTQIPNYVERHPDVVQSADVIAQYFVEEGDKLVKNKEIDRAYIFYSRARYMNNVMGKGEAYSVGETKFIEAVDLRIKDYAKKSITTPIYGLVSVLEELSPNHPAVIKYKQSMTDTLLNDATFKIIPAGFSGVETKGATGTATVAKINQKLLKILPKRVQVIDTSLVASDYRSAQIVKKPNPTSYLFFSGEIVDVSVTEFKTNSSVTKQVLTRYEDQTNPLFLAWQKLKSKATDEAPPKQVKVPVEENVTIKSTMIKKQGIFSITYRLADAVSASVVFSDALNKKEVATGENIEGLEVGLFKQPAKISEMPDDSVILETLSNNVADEVASKIAEQIQLLEKSYLKKADQAVILEDFNAAASNYAYNDVLLQSQGGSDADAKEKMRIYALRWR